jgi:predicted metal-dependent hydrolase
MMKKTESRNPPSKTVTIDPVGPVLLERSRRAKRISLTVRPFKGVRVAVPVGVSFQQAREVAQSNAAWIARQLQQARRLEKESVRFNRHGVINRAVARRIIAQRLETLAQRHGFSYQRLFVRSQKTRWGSCSMQNNINLNVHLICLPSELMDYVILHELVHTRIKDHSIQFWNCLAQCIEDPKALDRELTRYEVLLA